MVEPIIFHIDVNSAFLSWEACYRKDILGYEEDIRLIPSVIGGDEAARHGIVLAKSIPAKKYKITTGEPLMSARRKCPELKVFAPNYPMYVESSRAFIALLRRYAPAVEQYSIDEAFCDFTGTEAIYGSPVIFANELRELIHRELGFTVNIGVSSNKLLAKTASDFQKPDKVHTLFPNEIESKMWPLPVSDLLFVGKASLRVLQNLGIFTIGDLAHADVTILKHHLKKHGEDLFKSANGIDISNVTAAPVKNKGYGNSLTIRFDVSDRETALMILLSLCETVGARIRADHAYVSVVSVSIVDASFAHASHQRVLPSATDLTQKIYQMAKTLFDEFWNGNPIRQLGVHTSKATTDGCLQYDLFDGAKLDKYSKLNSAIDEIRNRYGDEAIQRACFVNSNHDHMPGGLHKSKRGGITKEL